MLVRLTLPLLLCHAGQTFAEFDALLMKFLTWKLTRFGSPVNRIQAIANRQSLPCVRFLFNQGIQSKKTWGGFLFAVSGDRVLFSKLDSDSGKSLNNVQSRSQNDSIAVPRGNCLWVPSQQKCYIWSRYKRSSSQPSTPIQTRGSPNGYRVLESSLNLLKLYLEKPLRRTGYQVRRRRRVPDETFSSSVWS